MTEPKVFKRTGATQGLVHKQSGLTFDPKRDLSYCISVIIGNSVIMTQNQLEHTDQATPENMEILDTIANMFASMYRDSRQKIKAWVKGFKQLYRYVQTTEGAPEVYASFCMYAVLNMYAYLFTSVQMATNAATAIDTQDFTREFLTASLSVIGKDKAEEYMKDFAQVSAILAVPPMEFIAVESKDYMKEIRMFQKEQRELLEKQFKKRNN